jgi:ribosomal protein S18 acetylase RimI-like enzyme
VALYGSAGFAETGRRRGYYGGTDAVVMALVIGESGVLSDPA